ncbi:hypothetical protein FRC05_001491, partial [Tulasnella sp. 425]
AITGNFPFDEENDLAIILRITRGDLPVVGDHAQLKQVKALCSLMGECWRLDANERPTAIRCQQVLSFMNQFIPSSSKVSGGSAATRSSGLLCALGWIQMGNSRLSEAEKYFQESFVVAKSAADKEGSARALRALGSMYQLQSRYPTSEESYIQARDTYSEIGNRQGFAEAVKGLGDVYYLQSKYSNAEESYIQARDANSQIGDQQGFANSLDGLGDVYRMRSEYSKAEESSMQARDTYSRIGDQQGFANSVWSLGEVYGIRSEYSKAEESYIQARDTYSQIGNQLGFANSVKGLGDVYRMRSEYSKAEESYIQARDTYSQIGYQLGFANSVQGLGQAYSDSGQYAQAENSYLEAESVYRRIGDMRSLANNIWYLGGLRRNQAQYGEAERLVCEASTIYGNLGLEVDVADCDTFLRGENALKPLARYFIPKNRLDIREKALGRGGYGVVKLAELVSDDRSTGGSVTVAIKVLQTDDSSALRLRVAYPEPRNRVPRLSVCSERQRKGLLANKQAKPEERLELVRDTLKGLQYLHTRDPPIIHGDLKSIMTGNPPYHDIKNDAGVILIVCSDDDSKRKTPEPAPSPTFPNGLPDILQK